MVKKYTTNREALRWCKHRKATVFWGSDGMCEIRLGTKRRTIKGRSLIIAANRWIEFFDKQKGNVDE